MNGIFDQPDSIGNYSYRLFSGSTSRYPFWITDTDFWFNLYQFWLRKIYCFNILPPTTDYQLRRCPEFILAIYFDGPSLFFLWVFYFGCAPISTWKTGVLFDKSPIGATIRTLKISIHLLQKHRIQFWCILKKLFGIYDLGTSLHAVKTYVKNISTEYNEKESVQRSIK